MSKQIAYFLYFLIVQTNYYQLAEQQKPCKSDGGSHFPCPAFTANY